MRFSILVILFLSMSSSSIAQILYHNVQPDSFVQAPGPNVWTSYGLDLDQSGSPEYSFDHVLTDDSATMSVEFFPISTRTFVILDSFLYPSVLSVGDSIGPASITWGGGLFVPYLLSKDSGAAGSWPGIEDGYLGLRIEDFEENFNYGWVRIAVGDAGSSFTIKGYAINTRKNEPIAAGQTVAVGVASPLSAEALDWRIRDGVLYLYPKTSDFQSVRIYALSGQLVAEHDMGGMGTETQIPLPARHQQLIVQLNGKQSLSWMVPSR